MASKESQELDQARKDLEASLKRQDHTGQSPVEQAYARAEEDGNPIVGDPRSTRMDEVPQMYREEARVFTPEWLAGYGMDVGEMMRVAREGLMGDAYRLAPPDALKMRMQQASSGAKRLAQIDAGNFASRTLVDPLMELYWEGKAAHPKHPERWVTNHSVIPKRTETYGINGRLWHCVKGQRRNLPTEVLLIMIDRDLALQNYADAQEYWQRVGSMSLVEKVRAQGGDRGTGYIDMIRSQIPDNLSAEAILARG